MATNSFDLVSVSPTTSHIGEMRSTPIPNAANDDHQAPYTFTLPDVTANIPDEQRENLLVFLADTSSALGWSLVEEGEVHYGE